MAEYLVKNSDLIPGPGWQPGLKPLAEHPTYGSYESIPYGSYSDSFDLIPRDEWPERIKEMDAKQMWAKDHCTFPAYHQGATKFCWINCIAQAMRLCRAMQGLKDVDISSASMGAPIQNYRNRGGWIQVGLDYAIKHGAVPAEDWPNNAIDDRYDTAANDALRESFKVLEAYKCPADSFDEIATAAFRGHLVCAGFGWWGHAVMAGLRIVDLDGTDRWGNEIRNSWGDAWGSKNRHGVGGFGVLEVGGRWQRGNQGVPDSVVVIASVTPSA